MNGQAALWLACVAAEGAALVMALRRRRDLPLAIPLLLAAAVVIDLVIIAGQCAVLQGPRAVLPWASRVCAASPAARPFAGLARAVYHVESALVMAWPLALAWACWRVFVSARLAPYPSGASLKSSHEHPSAQQHPPPPCSSHVCPHEHRRSQQPISDQWTQKGPLQGPEYASSSSSSKSSFMAWSSRKPGAVDYLAAVYVGFVVSLVTLHPLGATRTQWLLLAWEVVALLFAGAAIVLGWRRAVGGQVAWTVAHGVLLVLVPVEAAVVAIGPFARPSVFSAWEVARWQYLAAFAIVAGMLGIRRKA